MRYEMSMRNIKVTANGQSLLIVVSVYPRSNRLLLLADIHETERNPAVVDNSGIWFNETPVNKLENIY